MLETQAQKKTERRETGRQLTISTAEVLRDYSLAVQSRQASLIGRREVLSGKAKFGIFGDGKELAQIAMARAVRPGDFRTGYYRDQTFMFALGATTIQQFFAQLYAHADVLAEPNSAGRQMNSHFATRLLDEDGRWLDQTQQFNSAADLSPTASQMPRLVGLGYASRLYRELDDLKSMTGFSRNGNEVAFGTIGNASTAEGHFWETVNAIGVLRLPVVISIWDDEYGISVPNAYQITKGNLSEVLAGFRRDGEGEPGFEIFTVKGWDYPALIETYARAADLARDEHVPVLIHVIEMTQPQGHSTSGSHERYKSPERLAWEQEHDCLRKLREWILEQRLAPAGELDNIERNAEKLVENFRMKAWQAFTRPIYDERQEAARLMAAVESQSPQAEAVAAVGPGKFAGLLEARATLLVESIDKASRSIVLKNARGEQMKVIAGDEIKNFDQIKAGDQVVTTYTQELMMTLKKGGGALRERIDSSQQGSASAGQKPAAYEAKEVAFIADVQQVDLKKQTVTLRGAKKTVTLKIRDPEQLKLISKGDQVEGIFSEAVAIAVVPAPAKAKK